MLPLHRHHVARNNQYLHRGQTVQDSKDEIDISSCITKSVRTQCIRREDLIRQVRYTHALQHNSDDAETDTDPEANSDESSKISTPKPFTPQRRPAHKLEEQAVNGEQQEDLRQIIKTVEEKLHHEISLLHIFHTHEDPVIDDRKASSDDHAQYRAPVPFPPREKLLDDDGAAWTLALRAAPQNGCPDCDHAERHEP